MKTRKGDEMLRLKDRVAIVTGGASGIGKAIAETFAREGAAVVIGDVREDPKEGGASTLQEIQKMGGKGAFLHADVAKWDDLDGLVSLAVERFGKLDVMVNNAAIGVGKTLLDTTEEEWDRVIDVNMKGVFLGCKRAIQQMLTQEAIGEVRGRIVNISSQHGMISSPRNFAYGVGKSGVVYMTRQVASDYAKEGIICNAVAPGRILTGKPMDPEDPLTYSRSRTPMPRLGRPQDVANAALFLASDEATFMTGHNLMVDGGWMAS